MTREAQNAKGVGRALHVLQGGRTKCQLDKMSTGRNANQRLAFCPDFFLGWHFVRLAFCPVGILSAHLEGTPHTSNGL